LNKISKPNPGSELAIAQGCKCAVIDNHYGKGYHGQEGIFMFSGDCPLHGVIFKPLEQNVK